MPTPKDLSTKDTKNKDLSTKDTKEHEEDKDREEDGKVENRRLEPVPFSSGFLSSLLFSSPASSLLSCVSSSLLLPFFVFLRVLRG
jgi:hypothetical protein